MSKNQPHELFDRVIMMRKRSARPAELLRDPEAEYAEGWHMCVPRCFNDALDIKMKPSVMDGEKTLQWTQGSAFAFAAGSVLYDTPKAYRPWTEALKHINICVQIREATDAVPGDKPAEDASSADRNPGLVKFDILVPDKGRTKLVVKDKKREMKQDEFVRFIIFGPSTIPETGELFEHDG